MKILLFFFIGMFLQIQVLAFDHEHRTFDQLIKKYVVMKEKQSLVNYSLLKKKDAQQLESYLQTLTKVTKKEFDSFSKNDQLAFLINVYNAYTIQLILNHYPVKSIKDIGSFFSNAWNKKFFSLFGEKTTLDTVEHKMIRKWFKEPRIHFAVNCASIGCPSLYKEAFTGKKLNKQLEAAARHFIGNETKNFVNTSRKRLQLSKIFDWYEEDFVKASGSLIKYLTPYLPLLTKDQKAQDMIKKGRYKVKSNSYDWNLNEVK